MKPFEQLVTGVYFIQAPNQSKIKIGRSVDIKTRYKQLRTGFMDEGILLICIPTDDDVKLESVLHAQFDHLRANGEWFFMTKEIDDFILHCKFEYPNVIIYRDLNEIQSKLSYNSLEMLDLINTLKSVTKKYSIPIISGAIGILIAYYNYKLAVPSKEDKIEVILSFGLFLAYPILTISLLSQITKYESVRTFKFYTIFLVLILVSGVVSLFFKISHVFLIQIQIVIVSFSLPAIKNIAISVLVKQADEKNRLNVKELLPRAIISKDDLIKVIKQREFVNKRIKQRANILNITRQIFHTAAFFYINVYFLLFSESEWMPRLIIVTLTDITVALWLVVKFIEIKAISNKFIWIKTFKKWLLPFGFTIINSTLLFLKFIQLSFVFGGIIMASMIPSMLIMLFTAQRIKKDKFERDEIDKLLYELK